MALAYLKIDGPNITGNSMDSTHQNWIDVDEVGFEIEWDKDVVAIGSGTRVNGKPAHRGVTVKKPVDKSSPVLRQASANGTRLGTVTLDLVNLAKEKVQSHQMILTSVLVSKIAVVTENDKIFERVEFRYSTVRWKHTSQDSSGKATATSEGSWDLEQNAPLPPS